MKTTLGEIMKYDPCGQMKGSNMRWDKLVSFLGTDDLDTEVTFRQILESNGIEDTVLVLRTQPYRDYCLFLAEVAESVLYIYEKEFPADDRPRKAIEGIRRYHSGEISLDELKELSIVASSATSSATSSASWDAAFAASSAEWAARAAASDAVGTAAMTAAWAASSAAEWAAMDAASDAVGTAAMTAAWAKKMKEMEKILLKYI